MTRSRKFNTFMEHITIDNCTLTKYREILDKYIKENNLWEENHIACWLFDLIDYKLQGKSDLCYRSIRMLETYWGFDSDNDDIDLYIERSIKAL